MIHLPVLNIRIADNHRYKILAWLFVVVPGIFFIQRVILMIGSSEHIGGASIPGILIMGTVFDLIFTMYYSIPLLILLCVLPGRLYRSGINGLFLQITIFLMVFAVVTAAAVEWFFWQEYHSRFNFIAVDYLLYSQHVPDYLLHSSILTTVIAIPAIIISSAIFLYLRPHILRCHKCEDPFKERTKSTLLFFSFVFMIAVFVDNDFHHLSKNHYTNELSGNGPYEFFAAYNAGELDYCTNYAEIGTAKAFSLVKERVDNEQTSFLSADSLSIKRYVKNNGGRKRMNVVIISVESLSAGFMNVFGNEENLTPTLDSLVRHSMFFTNVYATGTRTVRGLEAMTLGIPPTPGQAILRRPHNYDLFSLGSVLDEKGYTNLFLYGSYGYFDNLNYFFTRNHYEVDDRAVLKGQRIAGKNYRGIPDEKLYELALREINSRIQDGKPLYVHIMTTSNQKPYKHAEDNFDSPERGSLKSAVRYSDHALGSFLRDCRKRHWSDSTIFVITADHGASGSSNAELIPEEYHIPLLIYAPGHVKPQRVSKLMSQVDIAPTVLGLMEFSYNSKFFGYDIFKTPPEKERAFISTYQKLGLLKRDELVILSPLKQIQKATLGPDGSASEPVPAYPEDVTVREAIAWYQSASYSFDNGLCKRRD